MISQTQSYFQFAILKKIGLIIQNNYEYVELDHTKNIIKSLYNYAQHIKNRYQFKLSKLQFRKEDNGIVIQIIFAASASMSFQEVQQYMANAYQYNCEYEQNIIYNQNHQHVDEYIFQRNKGGETFKFKRIQINYETNQDNGKILLPYTKMIELLIEITFNLQVLYRKNILQFAKFEDQEHIFFKSISNTDIKKADFLLLFEDFEKTLLQEIEEYHRKSFQFSERNLKQLLFDCLSGLIYLKQGEIILIGIDPNNIFKTHNNTYKIANLENAISIMGINTSQNDFNTTIIKLIQSQNDYYLSPEMKQLKKQLIGQNSDKYFEDLKQINLFKSCLYSLGVVILQCAQLNIKQVQKDININDQLYSINTSKQYSQQFVNFLNKILQRQNFLRSDARNIQDELKILQEPFLQLDVVDTANISTSSSLIQQIQDIGQNIILDQKGLKSHNQFQLQKQQITNIQIIYNFSELPQNSDIWENVLQLAKSNTNIQQIEIRLPLDDSLTPKNWYDLFQQLIHQKNIESLQLEIGKIDESNKLDYQGLRPLENWYLEQLIKIIENNQKNLRILSIIAPQNNNFQEFSLKSFFNVIAQCSRLIKLELEIFIKKMQLDLLESQLRLEHITLKFDRENELTEDQMLNMIQLIHLKNKVQYLEISLDQNNDLTDEFLKKLSPFLTDSLQHIKLNLSENTNFTTIALESFMKQLGKCQNLITLHLNFNENQNLTDNTIITLANNLPSKSLQHLELILGENSQITDSGIIQLFQKIGKLKKLKCLMLDFSQNLNLTDRSLIELQINDIKELKSLDLDFKQNLNFTDYGLENILIQLLDLGQNLENFQLNVEKSCISPFIGKKIEKLIQKVNNFFDSESLQELSKNIKNQ